MIGDSAKGDGPVSVEYRPAVAMHAERKRVSSRDMQKVATDNGAVVHIPNLLPEGVAVVDDDTGPVVALTQPAYDIAGIGGALLFERAFVVLGFYRVRGAEKGLLVLQVKVDLADTPVLTFIANVVGTPGPPAVVGDIVGPFIVVVCGIQSNAGSESAKMGLASGKIHLFESP